MLHAGTNYSKGRELELALSFQRLKQGPWVLKDRVVMTNDRSQKMGQGQRMRGQLGARAGSIAGLGAQQGWGPGLGAQMS